MGTSGPLGASFLWVLKIPCLLVQNLTKPRKLLAPAKKMVVGQRKGTLDHRQTTLLWGSLPQYPIKEHL